eukprot:scaffold669450_cov75-Prasinocladus_malaysianus.AAC.1
MPAEGRFCQQRWQRCQIPSYLCPTKELLWNFDSHAKTLFMMSRSAAGLGPVAFDVDTARIARTVLSFMVSHHVEMSHTLDLQIWAFAKSVAGVLFIVSSAADRVENIN